MTRTVSDPAERARLAGDVSVYAKVLIEDADGVQRDLTAFHGVDWFVRAEIASSIDDRAMTLSLTLVRETEDSDIGLMSLAPQIVASPANHKADASYAPLVNPARKVRVLVNVVPYGQAAAAFDYAAAHNPSFETGDATGWSLDLWALSAVSPHTGAWSIAKTAASDSAARNTASRQPCVPGDVFTVTGWMKGVSGADGRAVPRIQWQNSSGVEISTTDAVDSTPSDGVYHRASISGTAPAGAAFAQAEFVVYSQTAGTWYADDITFISGAWKRLFDGKIDSVDPSGADNTILVTGRDRAAWLLNTWIETTRTYGSDTGGTPIETILQQIINDNAVPFGATLVVPVSPDFNLGPPAFGQDDQSSVMDAIYTLALLQGGDVRYIFPDDGDSDPELTYIVPARDKTVPDWSFGPDEYLEITKAPIDDSDVRNAITVDYPSSTGRAQETATNAASINAFGRRWGKIIVKDNSQIDTSAEALVLANSVVNDLGSPPFEHEMRTYLFWPLSLGDLVRFLSNSVLYDEAQDLAVVSFTHTIEAGEGYTTMQCRGTPAGAYRAWLGLLNTGAGASRVLPSYDIIAEDATTITLAISGTIIGSSALPLVAWAWSSLTPPVNRVAGALQLVFVASGSQWTFNKPNPGTGNGTVGFLVGQQVGVSSALLQIPIPEGTAFPSATIDAPVVTIDDDPIDDIDVAWVVHTMPGGQTYNLFYRLSTAGAWHEHGGLTTESDTITHAELHMIIAAAGTQNAVIQVYIEAIDSFGAHIAQSDVTTQTFHSDGFG